MQLKVIEGNYANKAEKFSCIFNKKCAKTVICTIYWGRKMLNNHIQSCIWKDAKITISCYNRQDMPQAERLSHEKNGREQ